MTELAGSRKKHVPGTYAVKKSNPSEIAGRYIWEWEQKRGKAPKEKPSQEMPPAICFSRDIGVGALEVADLLRRRTGFHVHDKTILTFIAQEANIREQTVAIFDELYPGKTNEILWYLISEKSFTKSDYARHLFRVVVSLSYLGSSIFVGRGAHLILPRERILAVRLISGRAYRIKRLTRTLNINEQEADRKIDQIDKEQRDFFRKVFRKKDVTPYEFDLVINFDYLTDPQCAAEVVATAFSERFGSEYVIQKPDPAIMDI
ncbi:MAG: cytidylate kinase-like family protein [Thermodesulfobacteriota bacterium]